MTFFHTDDHRSEQRWDLRFPATLHARAQGQRAGTFEAELEDVGPRGARVRITKPIAVGTEIVLDVHCKLPGGNMSTLRFKGKVVWGTEALPFRVGIEFRGRGRFLRDSLDVLLKRTELLDRSESLSNGAR